MRTDKTLADVQPGGRVRLGDALTTRRFIAGRTTNPEHRQDVLDGDYDGTEWFAHVQAALSAQPSPGGQDAVLASLVAKWRAEAATHELNGLEADSIGLTVAAMRNDARHHVLEAAADELEAALAARQPVGEPVGRVRTRVDGGFIAELLPGVADRVSNMAPLYLQPPAHAVDLPYSLDADPAGIRARVCDVITGTLMVGAQGHTPPPAGHWADPFWKAAHADAKAQAVDLGQIIEQIAQQWDGCNYDAVGETIDVGRAIRSAGKRLIDSQAVGK